MKLVKEVTVILDYGGQGVRDITAEAWAVLNCEGNPAWPTVIGLSSIHMTEEQAREALAS